MTNEIYDKSIFIGSTRVQNPFESHKYKINLTKEQQEEIITKFKEEHNIPEEFELLFMQPHIEIRRALKIN
jgi:hypothetical protein